MRAANEHTITKPRTPTPWYHYISNETYGVQCSQTAGGFSIFPMLEGRRLIFADRDGEPGRRVYVRDLENGAVWTLNRPGNGVPFKCRFGLGYSVTTSRARGIEGSLRLFVPPDDPVEIWTVELVNRGKTMRRLAFYPFVEWFLGGNLALWDDPSWYTQTRYQPRERVVTARLLDPQRLGTTHEAFMAPLFRVDGYACHRQTFLGPALNVDAPEALRRPALPGLPAKGEPTIGVVEHRLSLAPGERRSFDLLLGYAETPERRKAIVRRYRPVRERRRAFAKVTEFWNGMANRHTVHTPDPIFDRWINVWLKYQEIQCHRWAGGGAANSPFMGYRDVLQHVIGMALFDPAAARERFLEAMRYQYRNGRAVRGWSRSGRHDTRDYRDSSVWIIFALTNYLKETGDFGLLDEEAPFLDGGGGTVLEHAQAALRTLTHDRGAHGLSRIGEGDWLDPLNRVGVRGHGESVWLSMAVHLALIEMAELLEYRGQARQATAYRSVAEAFRDSIQRHGWDGQWYLQAYDDEGRPVGSRRNKEGRIYLMPQAWAVLSGVADAARARRCMASAERHLGTAFGYKLWAPGYGRYDPNLGGISILQIQPLVYAHGTAFKILADCVLGRGGDAYRTFMALTPDNPENPPAQSWAPPHIIPNGYHTTRDDGRYGRMCYYGFSGAFPWLLKAGIEWIGGARAEYAGLRLDPHMPDDWTEMTVYRRFRGADYHVAFQRTTVSRHPAGQPAEKPADTVAPGTLLPPALPGKQSCYRCLVP